MGLRLKKIGVNFDGIVIIDYIKVIYGFKESTVRNSII